MSLFIQLTITTGFILLPILLGFVLAYRSRRILKPSIPSKFIRYHVLLCLIAIPLFYVVSVIWLVHPLLPIAATTSFAIPISTFGIFTLINIASKATQNVTAILKDLRSLEDIIIIPNDTTVHFDSIVPKIDNIVTLFNHEEIVEPYKKIFKKNHRTSATVSQYTSIWKHFRGEKEEFPHWDEIITTTNKVFTEHGTEEMEQAIKEFLNVLVDVIEIFNLKTIFHCSNITDESELAHQEFVAASRKLVQNVNIIDILKGETPSPLIMLSWSEVYANGKRFLQSIDFIDLINSSCSSEVTKETVHMIQQSFPENDYIQFIDTISPTKIMSSFRGTDMWDWLPKPAKMLVIAQIASVLGLFLLSLVIYSAIRIEAQKFMAKRYISQFDYNHRTVQGELYVGSITGLCFSIYETLPWCLLVGLGTSIFDNRTKMLCLLLHSISILPLYSAIQVRITEPTSLQIRGQVGGSPLKAYITAAVVQASLLLYWNITALRMFLSTTERHYWYIILVDVVLFFMLLLWESYIYKRVINANTVQSSVTTTSIPSTEMDENGTERPKTE